MLGRKKYESKLNWARGKTRLDHITNEDSRKEVYIKPVETFLENKRLKWFGHCLRREPKHICAKSLRLEVPGRRSRDRPKQRWRDNVKGRGWSKTGVCHISVTNQWIFTKFSAVVHYVMSHQIIKIQLICIIYAWISHTSKVPNEERYSEKTNYSKHMFSSVICSLHSRGCNSYFEIC